MNHGGAPAYSSSSSWLKFFGEDTVEELHLRGNARIARGAFGEVSLALLLRDDNDGLSSETTCRRVAAVKTLFQSTVFRPKTKSSLYWGSEPVRQEGSPSPPAEDEEGGPVFKREVVQEIWALRRLNPHPNIIRFLALYPSRSHEFGPSSLSLAFDYCPVDLYLTLEWRRRSFRPLLPVPVLISIAHDVFCALEHCHSRGVLHRDVKPGNLLVSSAGIVQLCDFGLARPFSLSSDPGDASPEAPTEAPTSPLGIPDDDYLGGQSHGLCTLQYRPPEVLLGGPARHASVDVYSAGATLAELLTGRPLFDGTTVLDQLFRVFAGLGTPTDTHWPNARLLPDYGKFPLAPQSPQPWKGLVPRCAEVPNLPDFLAKCLALDPDFRLPAADLLRHPWLRSPSGVPPPADRLAMRDELVPQELDEPLLLLLSPPPQLRASSGGSSGERDRVRVAADWAPPILELAARRRKLLSDLVEAARAPADRRGITYGPISATAEPAKNKTS